LGGWITAKVDPSRPFFWAKTEESMKVFAAVLGAAVLLMIMFLAGSAIHANSSDDPGSPEQSEIGEEHALPHAVAGKKRQKNGAACLRDNDCISRECKGFRCVDSVKRLKSLGESCWFDGDCRSRECKGFKCVRGGE
jgi:hypothetical protein